MKKSYHSKWFVLPLLFALLSTSCKTTDSHSHSHANASTESVDVVELLKRVDEATEAAKTLEADFIYTVDSVKQKQAVKGHIRLMKPNYARLTFDSILKPSYPHLVASDGTTRYSYTSSSFKGKEPLAPAPTGYDPKAEAKFASGLAKGGGVLSTSVVAPDGSNLRLWDAAPVQAFFGVERAIGNSVYVRNFARFKYEGTKKIDGITYRVLYHRFEGGNIAGGEDSDFDQRLYIGPDNLIHMYVMGFESGGKPGTQVAKLKNVRINKPMKPAEFAFTMPR